MRFNRQNKLLNDAIEALDQILRRAKGDIPTAWTLLSPLELEFITEEIGNCITSRTHYLQNWHIVQPETGILMGLYPMWDHQWMIEEAIQKERELTGQSRVIVLKPRQSGGSEYANAVMCHQTFFTPHAYTMTVAQDPGTASHMQRKVNLAWEHLPWWLRPERQYHTKGEFLEFNRSDEHERFTDPGLGSVFVTTHAQRISGVAIGKTIRNLHLTEVSRWPSGEVYTADIEPSMNAPDTMAICESTALGSDGFYYNLWQEAVDGDSDWKPVFLPVYRAKKFSLPIAPKDHPFVLTHMEAAIVARVQAEENFTIKPEFFNWRRRRLKAAIKRTGFPYAHYESYPVTPQEAFQSSGLCAFPRHKLDEQSAANVRRPSWVGEIMFRGMHTAPNLLLNTLIDERGNQIPGIALEKRETENRLYIWEKPKPNAAYYLSGDIGGSNAGNDFNVFEVWRAGNSSSPDVQVAEWVGYITPTDAAKVLYALGHYYNRCEVAVEYAKEGMLVANYLTNDLEYPNIYRPRSRDRVGKQLLSYLHWQTTSKTKSLIVATMNEALLEDTVVIRSAYLLGEMYKFSRDGTGYSGLSSHDDSVMSSCINVFCMRETMPELRSPATRDDAGNHSPTSSARQSGGAVVYGLYDQFFRLRTQTRDLGQAMDIIAQPINRGWQIKPIPVTRANTAYSVVHHSSGPENDLYRQGVDSRDITPGMVQLWRGAKAGSESDATMLNDLIAGGMDGGMGSEWGVGLGD